MLDKRQVQMIKKLLKQGLNKTPVENIVDPYLPYIAKMLETTKEENSFIPTTVIYEEIQRLGYEGSLRWLQQVMQKYELRKRVQDEEKLIRFETDPGKQMQVD